jgi:hypothetical protein
MKMSPPSSTWASVRPAIRGADSPRSSASTRSWRRPAPPPRGWAVLETSAGVLLVMIPGLTGIRGGASFVCITGAMATGTAAMAPELVGANGARVDRHAGGTDRAACRPTGRDRQAPRTAHPAPRVHHRCSRRRGSTARCARSRQPCRRPHGNALRPSPGLARPTRHRHRRHVPRWGPAAGAINR